MYFIDTIYTAINKYKIFKKKQLGKAIKIMKKLTGNLQHLSEQNLRNI